MKCSPGHDDFIKYKYIINIDFWQSFEDAARACARVIILVHTKSNYSYFNVPYVSSK